MELFSELPLHSALAKNLERHGFVKPTPVQAQSIPPGLEGRDVVATAQTGTGKTLAFALPIVQSLIATNGNGPVRAVILSPTRELAIQINETIVKLTAGTPIRTAVVVGGVNEQKQLKLLKRGVQIVVATPGRLCDFLDRGLVRLADVKCAVLDEADRMLDMGFLPAIREIFEELPAQRQTLLFSATIEKSVAHLIERYVENPARISIGTATKPAEHVDLHVYEVNHELKLRLLNTLLQREEGSFLVFARTKHGADRLADQLKMVGVDAARIHGNRSQSQRNQALQGFKDGSYRVLVATDVAARGIHVDGIAHVVNFDLPQAPEDFIHRAGRTGRAGARGTASTFATRGERVEIRRIEKAMGIRMIEQDLPELAALEPKKGLAKPAELPGELIRVRSNGAPPPAVTQEPRSRKRFGFGRRRRAAA
jgi:ATP-dependent RNA helicase RhlE